MATKKTLRRTRIKHGIRKNIMGTPERPRLAVFRSNKDIYAQLIDDLNGITITGASSRSKGVGAAKGPKVEISKKVQPEI